MPRPEPGKKYLIVFCKGCDKGFRVVDSAIDPAKKIARPKIPVNLKCRGCGHVATYAPQEIRIAALEVRSGKNRA
jgi:RNase P subunit RPR2